jgi:hypothetical protein
MAFNDRAYEITEELLAGQIPYAPDFYAGDLVPEVREFKEDLNIAKHLGDSFPFVVLAEGYLVPVALQCLSEPPRRGAPRGNASREPGYLLSKLSSAMESRDSISGFIDMEKARDFFVDGLRRFVAARLTSVFEKSNNGIHETVELNLPHPQRRPDGTLAYVSTNGFTVTVYTRTPGLRVHVSPSFRLNWRYFNSPTSPTKGALTGGIYCFGADQGPYSGIQQDPALFDIPNQTVTPRLAL